MTKYVAFLRAINVGKRTAKKEDLIEVFQDMRFSSIGTYIQSGNVIFETQINDITELEKMIEGELEAAFGFEVPTMLRIFSDLEVAIDNIPFEQKISTKEETIYVSFAKSFPSKDIIQKVENQSNEIDEFRVIDNNVYWIYHRNAGTSNFDNNKLEKILQMPATRRNLNTIQNIIKKFG